MSRKLLLWLKNNDFWRNVSVLAGSTAIGQIISVIATPVITRLYRPEDFGLLAVYTSILGIIGALVCLSYQIAILAPQEEADAVNLLALCFLIIIFFSTLSLTVVNWYSSSISFLLGEPKIADFLWLVPISIVLIGAYSALSYWAVRRKAYTHIAQTKISQSMGGVLTNIGLGLLNIRPLGLFIGTIIGQSAGNISLARLVWMHDFDLLKQVSCSRMIYVAKRYIRFPLLTTPTALINAVGTNIPALLLTTYFGSQVTGWFSLGQRLSLIPIALVGTSVGQVYLGEMASLAHSNPGELYSLFIRTIKRLSFIGLFPTAIFLLGGGQLVQFVFGEVWFETGIYLQLLSISFVVSFVATPVSQVFSLFERQDLALSWNVIRLLLIALSFWLVNRLDLSARIAVLFFAITMFIVDVWRLFLVSRVIRSKMQQTIIGKAYNDL